MREHLGHRSRLAVVSDSVHPWRTGGKEMRHHELTRRLSEAGVEVHVFTMKWWDSPTKTATRDGVVYHALCRPRDLYAGPRRSVTQALVFALSTFKLLGHRFDVVEVDAIPFLPLFPMRLVAWVKRRRMVVTWHEYWGTAYWTDYLGQRGRFAAWIERRAVGLPDLILAASEGTAERLRRASRKQVPLVVIPNGVRQLPSEIAARAAGPVPTGPLRLVSVGRLLANKNVDLVLRAVALLRDEGRTVLLDVIGEGPEAGRLDALRESLKLQDCVRFSPFIDEHSELLDRLAQAHVLAFPSVREGFGMVALEAMSVGTPVVTTDHPDNFARDLVASGVNGQICRAEPMSLARAILRAEEHYDNLAAAARQTAAQYDWDLLARQAAQAYGVATDSSAPAQPAR